MLNNKAIQFFITLEKSFGLLSGDLMDQDELFEMQMFILKEIMGSAVQSTVRIDLAEELPHLFERTKV